MRTLPLLIYLVAVCAASLLIGCPAAAKPVWLSAEEAAAKKDETYRAGQRDLDAGRFNQAIEKFAQVARQGGSAADGALYWKAYAENKAGRPQQALATVKELAGSYPKSAWLDDARALEVEIHGASGKGTAPKAKDDEELKLYALNGLLGSDPDRAVPMLQKFLQGNHSQRLKEQALFVLSQGDSPEAHKILGEVARGAAYPELQRKAIEYLAVAGGEENVGALDEIYRSSPRPEVKSAVLDAYLIANRRDRILAIVRDGKDPFLRGKGIDLLGALGATKELRQLYADNSSPDVRMRVLNALGVAGDAETLADTARREQDPGLRRRAIEALGVAHGPQATASLRALYAANADLATRKAVVEALFVQNNAKALIEIFRAEKDREIRHEIVQRLSQMDSDEASEFLAKIYKD